MNATANVSCWLALVASFFIVRPSVGQDSEPPSARPKSTVTPNAAADTDNATPARPARRQRRLFTPTVPPGVKLISDVVYREGNPAWKLDLALPTEPASKPRPGLIFVHGGGWRSGDKATGYFLQGALEFAQRGYVCITVNYRLTDEAPFPACVEDVKCAVRWLRAHADEYQLDPKRIGAYGNSAGAQLVCMLGLTKPEAQLEGDGPYLEHAGPVQAVCASATPTDLLNFGDGRGNPARFDQTLFAGPAETLQDRKKLASPVTHAAADAPPFLLIHGTADPVVPYSQAEALVKALQTVGAREVTLLTYDRAGHGVFGQHATETKPAMARFFARVLQHEDPLANTAAAPAKANDGEPNPETKAAMPKEGATTEPKSKSESKAEPASEPVTPPRRRDLWTWERMQQYDADKDGKISQAEFRGPARTFERLDANQDGFVEQAEFQKIMQRRQSQ